MIGLIIFDYFYPVTRWAYVLLLLLFSFILFYGSYFINSGFYIPVTCNGDRQKKQVALTFDDGPVEDKTSAILDTLRKNNVHAAFFCIGNRMKNLPSVVQRMEQEGHLVGNHSFTHHFFFDLFTRNKMKQELDATNETATTIISRKPRLFRPPYGVTTPVLARAISECTMFPVGWSLRSMDTVTKSENKLIHKIEMNIKPGDIVLLHDTESVTVSSLQKIIDLIRSKGLEPVRLDQLLKTNAYA